MHRIRVDEGPEITPEMVGRSSKRSEEARFTGKLSDWR
jgi:hypothetical protein